MKTSDFEAKFVKALTLHLSSGPHHFDVVSPVASASVMASPDVLIRDFDTGRELQVEIVGGTTSNSVPFATVSKLKRLSGSPAAGSRVLLISSAVVPSSFREMLRDDNIEIAQVRDIQEGLATVDAALARLD